MYGQIEVDSLPGEGTTMRIRLRPADYPVDTNGKGRLTAPGDSRRTDGVLVITDEPEAGIEMAETLEQPPRFVVATAVHRGLDTVLDARGYDAVIVDGTIRQLAEPEARRRFDDLDENVAGHLGFLVDDPLSEEIGKFLEQRAYPTLHRPFGADQLETFVGRLVAGTDAVE